MNLSTQNSFNTSILEIEFTFVNPVETIKLFYEGEECIPDENNKYVFKDHLMFPSVYKFEMSGKCPRGRDCKVDSEGNILWDRYIIISSLKVDNVMPALSYLERWGRLHAGTSLEDFRPSNQVVFGNYLGMNGVVELEFEGSDVLEWLMRTHQFRDPNWQQNHDYD